MIQYKSISPLRRVQILLLLLGFGNMFVPWVAYWNTMMNNDIEKKYMSGWDIVFGQILFVFLAGSMLVSLLESAFLRRASFCHIGLFGITILLGSVGCLVQTLPGVGPVGVVWGLWIHLILAIGLFATSQMLSPSLNVNFDGK